MKKFKKIKSLLVSFILTFILGFTNINVYAKTMNPDEIQGPAYVIGSHVFTREVNENTGYEGRLTTNLIMLASKTIESSNLESMIIYYKTATGMWINGLTGSQIDVPESFHINYTNVQLEEINDTVSAPKAPILSLDGGAISIDENTDIMTYQLSIYIDDIEDKTNKVDGVEVNFVDDGRVLETQELKYGEKFNTITTVLDSYKGNDLVIGKQYHSDNLFFEKKPNGYYSIGARTYVLDQNGKKNYSDTVFLTIDVDDVLPQVEIVNNYSNPDYVFESENYYTYKLGIKKPDAYVFKVSPQKFGYITSCLDDGMYPHELDESFIINVEKETIKSCWAQIGYYDMNGDFKHYYTQNTENNRIYFTIDTRKEITTPILEVDQLEENYDHNRRYGDPVKVDFRMYANADKDSLDYNVKGIEIYQINYDGINMNNFQYIASSSFVQVKPKNGMANYVGRAYAINALGQKVYSEYSNVVTVIRTPEIESSEINDRKVNVSIKNIEEYGTAFGLKYKVFNSQGTALTSLVSLDEVSSINVDRSTGELYIRIYKTSDVTENTYSAKSNKVKIDINEDLIEYTLNDGIIKDGNNITKYNEESLPYTLINPEKEGYVFIGWTGSNGDTPQTSVTIEKGTTGNLEYVANWILYGDVDNNGKIDVGDVTHISRYVRELETFNDTQKLVGDVNLDGETDDVDAIILSKYISDGCKYDEEGFAINLPYNSGEKYTISYDLKDGILDGINIYTYAQVSLSHKLQNPEKEGYVFIGWTGSNGNTPQTSVTIEEGTTGNLEYTANWIQYGDVDNNNKIDIADVTIIRRYLSNLEEFNDIQMLVADINIDDEVDDVDSTILQKSLADKNMKLPYETGEKYTISYNLQEGVIVDDRNIERYVDKSLPYTLKKPEKEGYVFIGWTGSNGNTPQTSVTIEEGTTGNLEYIANWEKAE